MSDHKRIHVSPATDTRVRLLAAERELTIEETVRLALDGLRDLELLLPIAAAATILLQDARGYDHLALRREMRAALIVGEGTDCRIGQPCDGIPVVVYGGHIVAPDLFARCTREALDVLEQEELSEGQ